ncbi:MAG: CAP domain-containing protein [Acidimicrobiales bacterium]|nr:CAP domain-containing protein [Acidimicrobiales bacterium]HRW37883.1 CAP domain-containing protein [Aquihabitans sp.]
MPSPSLRRALAAAAAILVCTTLLTGCFSANQQKMVDQINASRSHAGLGVVVGNAQAMDKAQRWAAHMAATGVIEHTGGGSRLSTDGLPRWCAVGENVGSATSTATLHDRFLASPAHRANILGPYDHVGTGVVRQGDLVYGVQIFYRAC